MALGGAGTGSSAAVVTAILLVLTSAGAATAAASAQSPTAAESPSSIAEPALAESLGLPLGDQPVAEDASIQPVLDGVGPYGWEHDVRDAYANGQAWAEAQLDGQAPSAASALAHVYAQLGVDQPVPTAELAELAPILDRAIGTLLTAQTAPSAAPAASVDSADPLTNAKTQNSHGAWLLGVVDQVIDTLEDADVFTEEPTFVDPLGIVIVGGTGDNHYTPTDEPVRYEGPQLLIEPDGNDTYDVPVAARAVVEPGVFGATVLAQLHPIALEFDGNDDYNKRVAASTRGSTTQSILIDRRGNDTYATTEIRNTTAHGAPGFAYLRDDHGNDQYHAKHHGLAQAGGNGISILLGGHGSAYLWDRAGDDTYDGNYQKGNGGGFFTHAYAEDVGSTAVLRDDAGQDTYEANILGLALSVGDSTAILEDRDGDDTYQIDIGGVSFGYHYQGRGTITESMLNRGFGYFLDGNGADTYAWTGYDGPPAQPRNDYTRNTTRTGERFSAFVDCQTPADADYPCPDEQEEVARAILTDTRKNPPIPNP